MIASQVLKNLINLVRVHFDGNGKEESTLESIAVSPFIPDFVENLTAIKLNLDAILHTSEAWFAQRRAA